MYSDNLTKWSNLFFLTSYIIIVLGSLLILLSVVYKSNKKLKTNEKPIQAKLNDSGFLLLWMGTLILLLSIISRGFAGKRFPWGTLFEFLAVGSAGALLLGLVLLRKPAYKVVLLFTLIPILIALFIAGTHMKNEVQNLSPALKSAWLGIHVTIICIGTGFLTVAGVVCILYLIKKYDENHRTSSKISDLAAKLPHLEFLDDLAHKITILGFPIYGIGILFGAIWAESAWGVAWNWDPKEVASLISWVIYAGYLHAKKTAGWDTTRAAVLNILGFVSIILNLFVINFFTSGLHSYASGM